MLTIRADGKSGQHKKDDAEVIQTLSKYLLREFKNGIKREVEEIEE